MFGLGPTELIIIFVLALVVLGPERIPSAAAQLGKMIRNFRKATYDLRSQVDVDGNLQRSLTDLHSAIRGEPILVAEEVPAKAAPAAPLVARPEGAILSTHEAEESPPKDLGSSETTGHQSFSQEERG